WKAKSRASHSFHEPLGNLAKRRRDSHIPTAPATKADGKVENQRQVFHFPTASIPLSLRTKQNRSAGGLRPPPAVALRAAPVVPFCSAEVGNFHSALDRDGCSNGSDDTELARISGECFLNTDRVQPVKRMVEAVLGLAGDRAFHPQQRV